MPPCCLTQYFSTVEGSSTSCSHSTTPEVVPWYVWSPAKAQGLAKVVVQNHIGGKVQLQKLQGSKHSSLLEHIDVQERIATRLPDPVESYKVGGPLPQRWISEREAEGLREGQRVHDGLVRHCPAEVES